MRERKDWKQGRKLEGEKKGGNGGQQRRGEKRRRK